MASPVRIVGSKELPDGARLAGASSSLIALRIGSDFTLVEDSIRTPDFEKIER